MTTHVQIKTLRPATRSIIKVPLLSNPAPLVFVGRIHFLSPRGMQSIILEGLSKRMERRGWKQLAERCWRSETGESYPVCRGKWSNFTQLVRKMIDQEQIMYLCPSIYAGNVQWQKEQINDLSDGKKYEILYLWQFCLAVRFFKFKIRASAQ